MEKRKRVGKAATDERLKDRIRAEKVPERAAATEFSA